MDSIIRFSVIEFGEENALSPFFFYFSWFLVFLCLYSIFYLAYTIVRIYCSCSDLPKVLHFKATKDTCDAFTAAFIFLTLHKYYINILVCISHIAFVHFYTFPTYLSCYKCVLLDLMVVKAVTVDLISPFIQFSLF